MNLAGVYDLFNEKWKDYQTCWIYSDPHFGDVDLRKSILKRPTDEELVRKINEKVGRKDVFICLGDVGPGFGWIQKIRGHKVLICGNHDKGASNYKKDIVHVRYDADIYEREEAMALTQQKYPEYYVVSAESSYDVTHAPFEYWDITLDNRLFDEVYEGPLMIGEKILLSHEPLDITFALNIHGHNHSGKSGLIYNHFNCCSDVIDYTPINLNQLLKSGVLSNIYSAHRECIDTATTRKEKRNGR